MPHLTIQNGNGAPQEHPLEGDLITVGRNPDNTIVIDDESVSGHHAEISTADGLYTVRDVHSSNGTTVNGVPTTETTIHDGDVICFGGVECRFQNQPTPHQSETSEPQPAPILPDESTENTEPHASFGSQLVGLGKAAFGEAQRGGRLAALKTRIEKLKLFDLNKAHYALGKKCYDLGLHREQFNHEFDTVLSLAEQIKERNEVAFATPHESQKKRLKRACLKAAATAEATIFDLKLKQILIHLGRLIATSTTDATPLKSQLAVVKKVTNAIRTAESAMATVKFEQAGAGVSKQEAQLPGRNANMIYNPQLFPNAYVFRNNPKKLLIIAALLIIVCLSVFLTTKSMQSLAGSKSSPGFFVSPEHRMEVIKAAEEYAHKRTPHITDAEVAAIVDDTLMQKGR